MALVYNASEIYQMGIEIEKNGVRFYTACAQAAKNAPVKQMCDELAKWEKQHVALFEDLKKNLPDTARGEASRDPDNELSLYVKAAADTHIFIANTDIASLAASADSPEKICSMALTFEKDSVVLYTSMARLVPEHLGKKNLESIIDEELKHISIITRKMAAFRK